MKKNSEDSRLVQEFVCLVRDILHSKEFREMKRYRHHVKGNLYDHSVKVAYLCYRHHKRHGLKIDIADFVRGALLHDYYLYDLHEEGASHKLHWLRHPARALQNAMEHYPGLTGAQQDMIVAICFPSRPRRLKRGPGGSCAFMIRWRRSVIGWGGGAEAC